jgi:hypothetical protein
MLIAYYTATNAICNVVFETTKITNTLTWPRSLFKTLIKDIQRV